MRTPLSVLSVVLMLTLIFAAVPVGAQDPLQPVGTVRLEATAVAAGVGVSWGDGNLKFKGKEYPFKVSGLGIATVGISRVSAVGEVYNLNNPADLAGTYAAVAAGLALGGGAEGLTMKNQKGVVINLRAVQQGINFTLGPQGFIIEMK